LPIKEQLVRIKAIGEVLKQQGSSLEPLERCASKL